jgi:hypothetical protein
MGMGMGMGKQAHKGFPRKMGDGGCLLVLLLLLSGEYFRSCLVSLR